MVLTLKDAFTKTEKPQIAKIFWNGCPAHFFVATPTAPPEAPSWRRAWGLAAGRGLTVDQALNATLGETIERMSVWCRGVKDPLIQAGCHSGSDRRIQASCFLRFSDKQLAELTTSWQVDVHSSFNFDFNSVDIGDMEFSRLECDEKIQVGALVGLFGEELRRGWPFQVSSSSGTAVRERFDDARETAVLELVERDAVALWWYHRLVPDRVPQAVARAALPAPLADWLYGERGRTVRFLDLPTDLPATVVAAISADPDGSLPALGFGAALDPAAALVSAALEAIQGEISLKLMADAQALPDPPAVPPLLGWSRRTTIDGAPFLAGRPSQGASDALGRPALERRPAVTFDDLAAAFARRGIAVYVADITRPEFAVPCARAISPDLRDWAPRFAPGRLYDVPVALGLRPEGLGEDDLVGEAFVI